MLVYKWDIFFFNIKCWIVVQFLLVTEVDAFCFSFWEFETIFCCPFDCLVSYQDTHWGWSYSSAEMQSVYSTAPADLATKWLEEKMGTTQRCYFATCNKFLKQHSTKQQVYDHLSPITERYAEHWWRNKGKLISNILE